MFTKMYATVSYILMQRIQVIPSLFSTNWNLMVSVWNYHQDEYVWVLFLCFAFLETDSTQGLFQMYDIARDNFKLMILLFFSSE